LQSPCLIVIASSGVVHLNETLGAPSARAMEKLFAAIDAEEKVRRAANVGASAERDHWRRPHLEQ
jgi:hypothetical protein